MILNLSNYIHSLLLENETVIIPGFGAFISTYKPAEISENEIKPPSKEISFTQQIKNNDGLLVEIIARKAKISQINALKRIEKARENMLYELDKGESVILENIGKLFYNENNEIQFISFQVDNLLLDSFGFETISMQDSIEKIDEIETETVGLPIIEKIIPHDQPEILPEVEKEIETVNEQKSESFKFPEFQPAPKNDEGEERRKIGWYWYLLILIPILIGVYFVINYTSKSKKAEIKMEQNAPIQQEEIQVETVVPEDSTQNDSTLNVETALNDNPQSVLSEGTQKYYLVGGGFESEENAENYILQLKEKGIEGFLFGKKGKLFLVGIESFDSEAEAMNSLNEHFKADPNWKIWIHKK